MPHRGYGRFRAGGSGSGVCRSLRRRLGRFPGWFDRLTGASRLGRNGGRSCSRLILTTGQLHMFILDDAHMIPDARTLLIQKMHELFDRHAQFFAEIIYSKLVNDGSPNLSSTDTFIALANRGDLTPRTPRPGRPIHCPSSAIVAIVLKST
jgi:hypothetical protein